MIIVNINILNNIIEKSTNLISNFEQILLNKNKKIGM